MIPYFPGHAPGLEGPRGYCGKKNCAAKLRLFGLGRVDMAFGGSGDPGELPGDDWQPGDRVEWRYNNMVAHNRAGFIVGRLAPGKSSFAEMGLAELEGEEILTATRVILHLTFELRGLGGPSFTPPDPIELRLARVLGPDAFEFVQERPGRLARGLGRSVLGLQAETLSVTGPRAARLAATERLGGRQRIAVREAESVAALRGKMVWIAHDPADPEVRLQCGLYRPGDGGFEIDAAALPEGGMVQVELFSLSDPGHVWAAERVTLG